MKEEISDVKEIKKYVKWIFYCVLIYLLIVIINFVLATWILGMIGL